MLSKPLVVTAVLVLAMPAFSDEGEYRTAREALRAGDLQRAKSMHAERPFPGLDEEIASAEACEGVLRECKPPLSSIEKAKTCKARLSLDSSDCANAPVKFQDRKSSLFGPVEDECARLKSLGTLPNGKPDPVLAATNECQGGMRWGYQRGNMISSDLSRLVGKFTNQVDCEGARVQDEESFPVKCAARYLGAPVRIKLSKVNYLFKGQGGFRKGIVYFSSKPVCKDAVKTLLTFSPHETGDVISVKPPTATTAPKFIGECAETVVTICKEFDKSPNEPLLIR